VPFSDKALDECHFDNVKKNTYQSSQGPYHKSFVGDIGFNFFVLRSVYRDNDLSTFMKSLHSFGSFVYSLILTLKPSHAGKILENILGPAMFDLLQS
jgi:hypothetical protein